MRTKSNAYLETTILHSKTEEIGRKNTKKQKMWRIGRGKISKKSFSVKEAVYNLQFFKVLSFLYCRLGSGDGGALVTQREIYYCLRKYFSKQEQLNGIVCDVLLLFGITRLSLGITSQSRGYVYGFVSFLLVFFFNFWVFLKFYRF